MSIGADRGLIVSLKQQHGREWLTLAESRIREGTEHTLVFVISSLRGDIMRATSDVENSISRRAISPCLDSKHFENGSVVYILKPLVVPETTSAQF